MTYIGQIADHPTPKTSLGGAAFTMNARDYKAPLVVVYDARGNGGVRSAPPSRETTRTGSQTTQQS